MTRRRTVELKSAYFWHCEDCGAENFDMPEKAEFVDDADREQAFRFFRELDPWDELPENWREFEAVHIPETVVCKRCGEKFATFDERGITDA